MLNETLRMTRAALEDSSTGVNQKIASLPVDGSDEPPPKIKRILDETQDDEAATGEQVPDWPILVMGLSNDPSLDGQASQQKDDAEQVVVNILYVTADANSAEAVQDTYYTQRAIYRSIEALIDRPSDRKRNKVQLTRIANRTYGPAQTEIEMGTITGFFQVTWQVRDLGAKD